MLFTIFSLGIISFIFSGTQPKGCEMYIRITETSIDSLIDISINYDDSFIIHESDYFIIDCRLDGLECENDPTFDLYLNDTLIEQGNNFKITKPGEYYILEYFMSETFNVITIPDPPESTLLPILIRSVVHDNVLQIHSYTNYHLINYSITGINGGVLENGRTILQEGPNPIPVSIHPPGVYILTIHYNDENLNYRFIVL